MERGSITAVIGVVEAFPRSIIAVVKAVTTSVKAVTASKNKRNTHKLITVPITSMMEGMIGSSGKKTKRNGHD